MSGRPSDHAEVLRDLHEALLWLNNRGKSVAAGQFIAKHASAIRAALEADRLAALAPVTADSNETERQLALYRKAINQIDDRIEYRLFGKKDITAILEELTNSLAGEN